MVARRFPRFFQTATVVTLLSTVSSIAHGKTRDNDAPKTQAQVRPVVILVHGLRQKAKDLRKLNDFLEQSQFPVLTFEYASHKTPVEEASGQLTKFVQQHASTREVHFVGFSLGNLVIRHCLGNMQKLKPRPRIGRVVMIAPPNHGAIIAKKHKDGAVGHWFAGIALKQLGTGFKKLQPTLATPGDFGIIAGGKGDGIGFSKKDLLGDDDDWLTVETTRLSRAADFRLVNAKHGQLDNHPRVHALVVKFLQNGYFESDQTRQRIP